MVTSTPFESPARVFQWLSGYTNLENGQTFRDFRLDRMTALADLAGRPEKCAPSIHVAGSKGKGSVTGMIAAILTASGIRTSRYQSPHVNDFRERISTGSGFFDDNIYINAGNELKCLLEKYKLSGTSCNDGEDPTFFELMTLWFFLCSRLAFVDAMAVETGMGGRLDATNILTPLLSVITLIELEHTEYLGNTIAAIAGEKAGIIKSGRPLVLAEQSAEALEVFKKSTVQKNSLLLYFPDIAEIKDLSVNKDGTTFSLSIKEQKKPGLVIESQTYNKLFIPMSGEIQAKNAGLAILSVKTVFPRITEEHIRKGLASFSLPARFEKISQTPIFIVDGSHTPHSMDLCIETFTSLYGKDGILIFGCAADKDTRSMAKLCLPNFSRVIITKPGTFKKSYPEEIYSAFTREAQLLLKALDILFIPETRNAIDKAIELALKYKAPVLGTGSFYLSGEIRSHLLNIRIQK